MPERGVFLTGFPGFIGRRLVARLLADDPAARITALVEPRMAQSAREAAAALDGGERIEVLEGDIGERRLALSDERYERLTAETVAVHHLAAIYDLAVPLAVAQRVNVEGTGNVLDLCKRCERLERLNYVSTAYVAGRRRGVVYEHELVAGQWFKNHYESTKYQAEVWVREELGRIPTTIYRPAIVVGDSRTGETQKFDGPYYALRAISYAARRGMPIAQFGRASAPMNVVPVDFIVDSIATLAGDPKAAGETVHLVDPEPTTAREVFALLSREYAGREPQLRVPAALVTALLYIPAVRRAYGGTPPEAIKYLNHPVRFDTRRADDLLARHGLRCPRFQDYLKPMVAFFREHEDDPRLAPAA